MKGAKGDSGDIGMPGLPGLKGEKVQDLIVEIFSLTSSLLGRII